MRERWNQLALREKQMLTMGAIVVSVLLFYLIIWSPLDNANNNLRTKIIRDAKLLQWMQITDKQISDIKKTSVQTTTLPKEESILTLVQHQINKTPLVSSLTQLKQGENNSVQLSFTNVEFDKLITWLAPLLQQGLIVSRLNISAGQTSGLVSADLTLAVARS